MKENSRIKETQPHLYNLIKNNKLNDSFSHAYLLSGFLGAPSLEIAQYFAQSYFCLDYVDEPCGNCQNCKKILDNNFLPIITIDGRSKTILKNDILMLSETFSKTSIEGNKKYLYIIDCVENMTKKACNALLKFLEEPKENILAILTTNNHLNVIDTIKSRCQIIQIYPSDELNVSLQDEEIEDKRIVELVSNIYNEQIVYDKIISDVSKINLITNLLEYISLLSLDKNNAKFYLENSVIPIIKSKEDAFLYLDILIYLLSESIKYHFNSVTRLKECEILIKNIYNSISDMEIMIFEIAKLRSLISTNINIPMILIKIHALLDKE